MKQINLIRGNKGKLFQDRIDREIIDSLKKHENPFDTVIILPNSFYINQKRDMLFDNGINGFTGQIFFTFYSFATQFCRNFRFIPDSTASILIKEILKKKKLKYYEEIKLLPGFSEALLNIIKEIGYSGFDSKGFHDLIKKIPGKIPEGYNEIINVIQDYGDLKQEKKFIDKVDVENKGLEAFSRAEFKIKNFILIDVYDLIPLENAIFNEIAGRSGKVSFFLGCPGNDTKTTGILNDLFKRLSNFRIKEEIIKDDEQSDPRLLAEGFSKGYSSKSGPMPLKGDVLLLESAGIQREILNILSMVKSDIIIGIPPEEISIVYRSSPDLDRHLERIAEKLGIKIEFMEVKPGKISIMNYLKEFLTLLSEDEIFSTDLISIIKNSFNRLDIDLLNRIEIDLASLFFVSGIEELKGKLKEMKEDERFLPVLNYLENFEQLRNRLKEENSLLGFINVLEEILRTFNFLDNSYLNTGNEYLSNVASMESLLDELEFIREYPDLFHSEMDLKGFTGLITSIINNIETGEKNELEKESVKVFDFGAARFITSKSVYIIHLQEETVPSFPVSDPFFKAKDRMEINKLRKGTFYETFDRLGKERFLFYLLLNSSTGKLVLSSCKFDDDGIPLNQSPFFYEIKKIIGDEYIKKNSYIIPPSEIFPGLDMIFSKDDFLKWLIWNFSNEERFNYSYLKIPDEEDLFRIHNIFMNRNYEFKPQLGKDELKDYNKKKKKMSASRLQGYLNCPFAYFVNSVLKVEDPVRTFDNRDIGKVIHNVLKDVFSELRNRGKSDLKNTEFSEIEELFGEFFDREFDKECPGLPPYLNYIQHEKTFRWAYHFLKYEAGFVQAENRKMKEFEWNFGFHGSDFIIRKGNTRMLFSGIIDRIDFIDEGIIIVDYKLTKYNTSLKTSILNGDYIQIPLYMYAARELGIGNPAGGELAFIKSRSRMIVRDKDSSSIKRIQIPISEVLEFYVNKTLGLYEMILSGDFDISPLDETCCVNCGLKDICNIKPWEIKEIENIRSLKFGAENGAE